ncbi:lipoprotein-releasing ABC transporter ATP-binding protein LolD [Pseudoalteromonas sp. G4]|uniref:lipoprotein-releasing ABC transporter ATP-binding protein LolD n=1 Tax=Pseudoalteromonas sp. G4 TaxID=2992761 RepID=UPI00237D8FD9|nr:lipoprotein-releasing ABC transporter ATP-binding protein LolD [Pseudoalteromonas sp. G4]MDE3270722.1 lipoprotein-releasing ABC transporter ATP-binding protein LolD [Pseudoalteromonas sp. G4]
MNNHVVVKCEHLTKSYQDGEVQLDILNDLNLDLEAGTTLAIVGSSGSGKSTLLHLLGTLDKPNQGTIKIKGVDTTELNRKQQAEFRNKHIGFIYQFHHLLMEFSALENVMLPLLIGGVAKSDAKLQATEMLHNVGLSHRVSHKPDQLSGGERQRVAIARALITKPALVLADEPTGNLDKENGEKIYELINQLKVCHNTAFIVVTHDLELAAKLDKTMFIKQGQLVSQ